MNKQDIENLNEAYDQMHEEYVPSDPKVARAMNAPGANAKFLGATKTPTIKTTKLSPTAGDGPKWVDLIYKEMGIRPRDQNAEEAVYAMLNEPIGQHHRVRKIQGKQMPGIEIIFDDGSRGRAFGVNPRSSVSKVLAATFHSYQDTFEKIAEHIIASSADEYEGM